LESYDSEEEKNIAKPWLENPIDFNKIKRLTSNFLAIFSDMVLQNRRLFCNIFLFSYIKGSSAFLTIRKGGGLMKLKIVVARCDKFPDIRVYHTSRIISVTKAAAFWAPINDRNKLENRYLKEIGEAGREIINILMDQLGIRYVYLEPYSLYVLKGSAFEWEEIQLRVVMSLSSVFASIKECIEMADHDCYCWEGKSECLLSYQPHRGEG